MSKFGATTLSMKAFSIMTLSIKTYFTTLGIATICHYAECRVLFIALLNVVMLNVVMLSVAERTKFEGGYFTQKCNYNYCHEKGTTSLSKITKF